MPLPKIWYFVVYDCNLHNVRRIVVFNNDDNVLITG